MQVYAKNDSKITLRQFDIKTNNVFGLKHAAARQSGLRQYLVD